MKPVNKTEIEKIVVPNSIPTKILKLRSNNNVSNQLSELFNLSFSLGVFPSILKSSKVISIFKKESKLKYSNYHTIFLPSSIDKILERIMFNRLYEFLESKNLI